MGPRGPFAHAADRRDCAANAPGQHHAATLDREGPGMNIKLGRRTLMLGTVTTLVVGAIALAVLGAGGIVAWEYSNSNAFCTNMCHAVHPGGARRARRVVPRARELRRVPHGPAVDAAADGDQADAHERADRHDHRLRAPDHDPQPAPGARVVRGLPLARGAPRRHDPREVPLRRRPEEHREQDHAADAHRHRPRARQRRQGHRAAAAARRQPSPRASTGTSRRTSSTSRSARRSRRSRWSRSAAPTAR